MSKRNLSIPDRARLTLANGLSKAVFAMLPASMRSTAARGMLKAANFAVSSGITPWTLYNFIEPTFRNLVDEGYRANSAVFACVSALAFAFIEPPLRVYSDEEAGEPNIVPKHPLARLLANPTAGISATDLLQLTMINLSIGGNCYWMKLRGSGKLGKGTVQELVPLNDAQMEPIAGGNKVVSHYELIEDSGRRKISPKDVVHFRWLWDPLHPWAGTAPLVAAAREVDTENEATRYVFNVLKNDAVPRLAIVAPKDSVVDADEAKRMKQRWREEYGGDERGGVGVLWGGVDVKRLSLDLNELAFEALRKIPTKRIAAALRVPEVVAGLNIDDPTYSNAEQAALWMTERTLVALWRMVEEKITSDLISEFDDVETAPNISVGFDLSKVVALQEKVNEKRSWALTSYVQGGITKNEYRAFVGVPRVVGGDTFLLRTGITEVAAVFEPTPSTKSGVGSAKSARAYSRQELLLAPISETKAAKPKPKPITLTPEAQDAMVAAQRQLRSEVGTAMQAELTTYFAEMGARVEERIAKSYVPKSIESKGRIPRIDELLTPADDAALDGIIKKFYGELMRVSWGVYNTALGVSVDFSLEDRLVTFILGESSKRVTLISNTTREALRDALQYGSAQGWSIDQLVRGDPANGIRGIRDIITETYKNRAETIARTELGTSQNQAATGRYLAVGVRKVRVYDNGRADDDAPCQRANGAIWTVEKADANPLEHPNCFVGDTLVLAPNLRSGFERKFDGEIIVLRTSTNKQLACTANHPILTERGWVLSGELREGDQIVYATNSQYVSRLLDPDYNDMPSPIQQVSRALLMARPLFGVQRSSDFHGDGVEGEVYVVGTNSSLLADREPSMSQTFSNPCLIEGGVRHYSLPGSCSQFLAKQRINSIPARNMSGSGHGNSLVFGSLVHRDSLRRADIANIQTSPIEPTAQRPARDSNFVGESLTAFTSKIASMQNSKVELSPQAIAALVERSAKLFFGEPNRLGNLACALTSAMTLVEVVEIERRHFAGHVFNLETNQGWYLANGIVASNCTRAYAPIIED